LQRIETIDEPHDREKALQPRPFDESTFHQKAYRDVTSGEGCFTSHILMDFWLCGGYIFTGAHFYENIEI